jgi:hypothetical protein
MLIWSLNKFHTALSRRFLCLSAMYKGHRNSFLVIVDLDIKWRSVFIFEPQPLFSRGSALVELNYNMVEHAQKTVFVYERNGRFHILLQQM